MNLFSRAANLFGGKNEPRYLVRENDTVDATGKVVSTADIYKEDIVYKSVNYIIDAIIKIPFIVKPIDEKDDSREAIKLVDQVNKVLNVRPNDNENRTDFITQSLVEFFVTGNVFFYVFKENIYLLKSDLVQVEYLTADNGILRKEYKLYNNVVDHKFGNKPKQVFNHDEIIHIKDTSKVGEKKATSRLYYLRDSINEYINMRKYRSAFFKNSAIPTSYISTPNNLPPQKKKDMLIKWEESYGSGASKDRGTAILDNDAKLIPVGSSNFRELDYVKSIDSLQEKIASEIGVPEILLRSGNNSNISPNRKMFYQETVIPIIRLYCDAFAHYYGNNVTIDPDKFAIEVLQPELEDMGRYFTSAVNNGVITPNEGRVGMGYKPITEGEVDMDAIRVPENIAGSATNALEGGQTPQTSEE